jgi:hypothetical protein
MTPQYRLVYSPRDQPKLVGLEPWVVPYFDISLLRSWVRDCEAFHGDQCTSSLPSDTQTCKFSLFVVLESAYGFRPHLFHGFAVAWDLVINGQC